MFGQKLQVKRRMKTGREGEEKSERKIAGEMKETMLSEEGKMGRRRLKNCRWKRGGKRVRGKEENKWRKKTRLEEEREEGEKNEKNCSRKGGGKRRKRKKTAEKKGRKYAKREEEENGAKR